ncbi:Down syndrome cell adhesion molecule homolog [Esox lucius]|uniref:Down syndrome cell adhesion molecule homolog n=1 Tax=Esox lucius TaxID=8010 RepID=UPI001476CBB1|nr:Down syndrome cell adhesion molecule homolog [Esox lucius]
MDHTWPCVLLLLNTLIYCGHSQDLLRASVKLISPQEPLFTGENVTLQCYTSNQKYWTFVWYRDNQLLPSQTSETITISLPDQAGQYQCHGKKTGRQQSSRISPNHSVRVTALPTASVSVSPHGLLYSGETVTLQCDISDYTDWTYYWFLNNIQITSQTRETITIILPSQAGQYQCQGKRTGRPQSSYISPNHPISVTALPTASVSVSPHGLLYSGETVTLQCDISDYTDWTYWWYRNKQLLSPGSPSKTITTLSDQVSQYQCQGRRTDRPQSSQRSVSLHISVTGNRPKATMSSDKKDILIGDRVALTCTVESSGWRFYWYRHRQDSEPVATTSGSSYTLSQVSVSDGGQYRCRAGRGDPVYYTQYSESVHIQVTVNGSSTSVLVGVVVGPVVAAVLLTIFLVLLCRYKKSKGSSSDRIFWPVHPQSTNQDPQQDQGYTQVQLLDAGYTGQLYDSADVSAGSLDGVYTEIELCSMSA